MCLFDIRKPLLVMVNRSKGSMCAVFSLDTQRSVIIQQAG
jgi:hypothetical protein